MSPDPDRLAYWLLKNVDKAVREYRMIAEGDRVAVAVSGGKDSLSLLRLLDLRRRTAHASYQLVAVHITGDARGPGVPLHQPLADWLAATGIETVIEPFSLSAGEELPMGCQRCTWNRRKNLFEIAHRTGCNVVAFGHHADDFAQTTLLNLLYCGRAETMLPRCDYFGGLIRQVRPLCYIPEKELRRFARAANFPAPPPACPRGTDSRRKLAADLLHLAETGAKDARVNLLRAGLKYTRID
ncbi:MAG TPA: ATP-binding protein [Anaerolineaceae bacterium]